MHSNIYKQPNFRAWLTGSLGWWWGRGWSEGAENPVYDLSNETSNMVLSNVL